MEKSQLKIKEFESRLKDLLDKQRGLETEKGDTKNKKLNPSSRTRVKSNSTVNSAESKESAQKTNYRNHQTI